MQAGAIAIIRFDLILETIAAIISLIVSHYANKAFHMTGQKKLSDLSTGFIVLSAGMFGRVIGTLYFFVLSEDGGLTDPDAIAMLGLVTVGYGMMKIMAYLIFAISTRPTRRQQDYAELTVAMALPVLLSPELEWIAIIILLVVVFQTLMNYGAVRTRYAMFVLLGFTFLLFSHVAGIYAQGEDLRAYFMYLLGQLLQFLGLISFLVMLRQAGKDE